MNKKVVLVGGAGAPNYGDELIVKAWIEYFNENHPDCNVTFFENIKSNEVSVHGESSNIFFSEDLIQVAKSNVNPKLTFWDQVKRGYNFIDNKGFDKYKEFDLSNLIEADIIILHGGGYLNDHDPKKGFFIGLVSSINEKYGTRIYASGIGFGPVTDPKNNEKEILGHIFSNYIKFELRDVDNFRKLSNLFKGCNFIYGTDDSYLLSIRSLVDYDDSEKRLYLSFLKYNLEKIKDDFWEDLTLFSKKFDKVYFLESYPWQDKEVLKFLEGKFDKIELITVEDLLNRKIKVSNADYACCSRFHVHYLFARSNVRGVYFQDTEYYDIKHQSIIDRGSNIEQCSHKSINTRQLFKPSYINLQDANLVLQKKTYIDDMFSNF